MGAADIVILIILAIALGIAGYFAFSGRGHGSCCDGGESSSCNGHCESCKKCRH